MLIRNRCRLHLFSLLTGILFFGKILYRRMMTLPYEKLRVASDTRGVVFEPIGSRDILKQKNSHVVLSSPGVIRGNHYHVKGEEVMAVLGPALVRTKTHDAIDEVTVPEGEAYQFVFKPGVSHAIKNMSTRDNLLAAFNTMEHDPENPDTVSDIIM
jgi:dTDP-4-dehydrorhamnose 3,5-epimerase-like enzyme